MPGTKYQRDKAATNKLRLVHLCARVKDANAHSRGNTTPSGLLDGRERVQPIAASAGSLTIGVIHPDPKRQHQQYYVATKRKKIRSQCPRHRETVDCLLNDQPIIAVGGRLIPVGQPIRVGPRQLKVLQQQTPIKCTTSKHRTGCAN